MKKKLLSLLLVAVVIDVYSICFCHLNHRVYDGTGLGTVWGITEQPIFLFMFLST